MLELLTDPQAWIAFATLTALELVLGIDNVIFISILVDKLPRIGASSRAASACSWRCSCASACCWCCRGSSGWSRRCSPCSAQEISGRDLILHRRRPVPDLEEHRRDPPVDGRRARAGPARAKAASSR
jgi:hypothetical protein